MYHASAGSSPPSDTNPLRMFSPGLDLPMLHDIDADYSPQYVKLARITQDKIESGEYERLAAIPATGLAGAYGVSIRVAYAALAILGANRYVGRVRGLKSYRVTWDARYGQTRARG
jgi:hypothetical protein